MVLFGSLLGAVIVIAWVAAIVHIVRRRHVRTGASTAAWILIVVILPIVGTAAYFLVYKMSEELGELDREGPAGSPQPEGSPFGDDLRAGGARDPDGTRFGR